MKTLNISDVRKILPELLKEIQITHETVTITRYGKPIVNIVPYEDRSVGDKNYPLRNLPILLSEDFDEPLPELWDAEKE